MQNAIKQNDFARVQQIHQVHPSLLCVRSGQLTRDGPVDSYEPCGRRGCRMGLESLCRACPTAALPPRFAQEDLEDVIRWVLDTGIVNTILETGVNVPSLHGLIQNVSAMCGLEALSGCGLLTIPIEDGPLGSIDAVRYITDSGVAISEQRIIGSLIRGACQWQLEPLIDVMAASRLCDSFRDDPPRARGARKCCNGTRPS